MRHDAGDPVAITKQVRACWRKLLAQRRFRTWMQAKGCEWVIAEEVTRGRNGWHPHLHALLMPTTDLGDAVERSDIWYENWCAIVEREMGDKHVPFLEHGTDLRPTDAAQYLTKLGFELTDSGAAKGASALRMLEAGQVREYLELQRARHGARDITYSRGLRALRDSLPKVASTPVLDVSQSTWNYLRYKSTTAPLDIQESADPQAAVEWWRDKAPVFDDDGCVVEDAGAPSLQKPVD